MGIEEDVEENKNILSQYDQEHVMNMGRMFAKAYDLDPELFARGAAVAQRPKSFAKMDILSEDEKEALQREIDHPWDIPAKLWQIVLSVSLCAATQGADETVINGANLFYPAYMGIDDDDERSRWLQGLVNGSPYLFCALVGSFITDPLNKRFGRKWVIFWSCFFSCITCFWQGFVDRHWFHLFIARGCLGALGLGPKSATVPVYSSEAAPAAIRGALTMLWQFFTAMGIALGYVFCIAFYYVPEHNIGGGLNWRLMLGSAMLPALLALAQIPFCPESPRWLMGKGRFTEAWTSLRSIRKHDITAARDLFYQYVLLKEEEGMDMPASQRLKELFTVRRNRNATIASFIVTFMQQFCGINVIAYYSSSIFVEADFAEINALGASLGFGVLNTVFALPAFFTIDRFGRRFLLLMTFPLMGVFLFLAGFSFWIPEESQDGRVASICLGIYIFTIFYSFGSGVVTFPYTAECFPLYIRTLGTSIAIGNLWFWNFILAITWPSLLDAFQPQGAFGWYAAWNFVGFFLVLWFLPETKSLTLEELDEVFDIPLMDHARYQTREIVDVFKVYVMRRSIVRQPPFYEKHRLAVTNDAWNEKPAPQHVE
ncbi:arabinose-proton symporter [Cyberlindnera jadinii NRRL Y-1542]|uniref:Arabinose-proton symporter n=1 Tax=Cyberlindnera jadinii (strain ATCC 18201 / CBS 1600 / BCRC 20928 / JCM 3617 / NBRC 0987 / NRRL Y-1542) TaxID=983966 RepID=A0A1E4S3W1_CYBJN|nr:arabinose-proton symporter [Cyberlindnera jadinii NRRL Y-1542]ODV74216.1 arabinose-proton symporter [Cyberlindnera jadinii NRRL Y-1542]